MPELPYRPEHFGLHMGRALTTLSNIVFSWSELCHAAVTVGRQNWPDVIRHGSYSVLEMLWRYAIIRANLVEEPTGKIKKSNAFIALDPSEKSAVSYFLGLCLTKLIADKLFGVTWLLHLDVYHRHINPHLALPLKPDFVGFDTNQNCIVFESKGRTGGATNKVLQKAKKQTRSLRHINGQLPALRVAVASYFSSNRLRARIWDPDDYSKDATDLPLEPIKLVREYYRPIVETLDQLKAKRVTNPIDKKKYYQANLPGFDADIGIDIGIMDWYRSENGTWHEICKRCQSADYVLEQIIGLKRLEPQKRYNLVGKKPPIPIERLQKIKSAGNDGVLVKLGKSWGPEFMMSEPKDRK